MAKEDLQAFLKNLQGEIAKHKKAKAKPKTGPRGTAAKPMQPTKPLESPLWQDEAIIYLATTTFCRCGCVATQTNPIPMLRRTHPRLGVHEESIKVTHHSATLRFLPVRIERREIDIDNCHECLSVNGTSANPFYSPQLEFPI